MFSLDIIDGQHRLIQPDGQPYFALGINHLDLGLFGQGDNHGNTAIECAASWFRDCGFTAGPYDDPNPLLSELPGVVGINTLRTSAWQRSKAVFADVFDDAVKAEIRETIRESCQRHQQDAHNIIGYFQTDIPLWDLTHSRGHVGHHWLDFIRALPAEAVGRRYYNTFLRERYKDDTSAISEVYQVELGSIDDLATVTFARSPEPEVSATTEDDTAFLTLIAHELYKHSRACFDEFDPGRLVFTERFWVGNHPDGVLDEACRYADALAIQPQDYPEPEHITFNTYYYDALYERTGKPIYIADHVFSFATPDYPVTLGHQLSDQEAWLDYYRSYLEAACARPYVLGYNLCQIGSWYDESRQLLKQGLLDVNGNAYPGLGEGLCAIHSEILEKVLPNQ